MDKRAASVRRDVTRWPPLEPTGHADRLGSLASLAVITSYDRGQEVWNEDRPSDDWYCIRSGAAARCVIRNDGRRHIADLLLPGDVFEFSTRDALDLSVIAVAKRTEIARYPGRAVEVLADENPQIAREIRQAMFDSLSRQRRQLLVLGRATATEKVGHFLVVMADRISDGSANRVDLPISRYEIADCLALSVETVSRALTGLRRQGAIALSGARSVEIIDRHTLEA